VIIYMAIIAIMLLADLDLLLYGDGILIFKIYTIGRYYKNIIITIYSSRTEHPLMIVFEV
jgi:hypothetical protein